jgi:galactoside O-acetyltransferase
MAWLSNSQLRSMGFASIGEQVLISDKASFHNCSKITLGNHVRIDDFCVISAGMSGICIGNYVHIAVYAGLIGAEKIELSDFSGVSSRVMIYSSNDDYSGAAMTGPMIPEDYTSVYKAPVYLGKHVVIGSGSVVLPGVYLEQGAVVGALSLVKDSCKAFGMYVGVPAKWVKKRQDNLLQLEERFYQSLAK